ncbi:MAG: glycosyltransferase family 2 protein [Patescibacteria group bacterium]|nr:glycosyltransferase family 2 protein [Patescibacteria group bacterium]
MRQPATKNTPKVSIVIVNFNGKDVLEKCLKSLDKIDYSNFQIVLVDNDSQDGSLQKAKRLFPQITFLKNKTNLGFSAGNNVGIRHALSNDADFILLLNNDTIVETDFLTKLVETVQKEPRTGIVCPLIYGPDMKKVWFSRGKIDWLRMKTAHETKTISQKPYNSDFISGCAMLIPRKVLDKVGLLCEKYFLYWEDADFCQKVQSAGFKLTVCPKSIIYHLEQSENVNENKVYWLVLSALIFFDRNCPWQFRPWIWLYIKLRKLNNFLNRKLNRGNFTESVRRAFKDFKNA